MRLYTPDGTRKYVTVGEREAFLAAAERADRQVWSLCMTLAYAGYRLSDALALTADRLDLAAGVLVFASLKKRRSSVFRAVPVPPSLLEACLAASPIRARADRCAPGRGPPARVRQDPGPRVIGRRPTSQPKLSVPAVGAAHSLGLRAV